MSDRFDFVEHIDLRPDWGPEGPDDGWEPEDGYDPGEEALFLQRYAAPRCTVGRLLAFHPPLGQPCQCGKEVKDFPEIA